MCIQCLELVSRALIARFSKTYMQIYLGCTSWSSANFASTFFLLRRWQKMCKMLSLRRKRRTWRIYLSTGLIWRSFKNDLVILIWIFFHSNQGTATFKWNSIVFFNLRGTVVVFDLGDLFVVHIGRANQRSTKRTFAMQVFISNFH